jgi:hypothetical protein
LNLYEVLGPQIPQDFLSFPGRSNVPGGLSGEAERAIPFERRGSYKQQEEADKLAAQTRAYYDSLAPAELD